MNIVMKFNNEESKSDLEIEVCENGNIIVSIADGSGANYFTINEEEKTQFINELETLKDIVKIVDSKGV